MSEPRQLHTRTHLLSQLGTLTMKPKDAGVTRCMQGNGRAAGHFMDETQGSASGCPSTMANGS